MNSDYREHYLRREIYRITKILEDDMLAHYLSGQVAVFIETQYGQCLKWVDCDNKGIPKYRFIRTHTISSTDFASMSKDITWEPVTFNIQQQVIEIYEPKYTLGWCDGYVGKDYFISAWEGKLTNRVVNVEDMDVSNLMKLAQNVIKNREEKVIETVQSNKLIK